MGAVLPAAGHGVAPDGDPQFLHSAEYGKALGRNGHADCEGGQQGYPSAGNPWTQLQDPNYRHVVNDPPHDRENSGPTFQLFDNEGKGHGLNPDTPAPGQTYTDHPGGSAPPLEQAP